MQLDGSSLYDRKLVHAPFQQFVYNGQHEIGLQLDSIVVSGEPLNMGTTNDTFQHLGNQLVMIDL